MLHKDPIIDCLLKAYTIIILLVVALSVLTSYNLHITVDKQIQQMNYFIEQQRKENKEMEHKIENLISDIKKEIK